ncbi:MAG: peptidoglycan bridge formation glycyltransferase FemA/FemB family protein [Alkalispirochaeta sp.]
MADVVPVPLNRLVRTGNLMQSALWGVAKRSDRVTPYSFLLAEAPPLLVLVYRVARDAVYAYVPWGPEPPEELRTGRYLEQLSRRLRPWLPEDCVFVRYDLPWWSPWSDRDEGRPPVATRELEFNFGTEEHRLRKAPTDVQPADTLVVDVSRRDEAILAHMKSKTRYNIRLARRRGVRVRAASPRELAEWYHLYARTMERHGKPVHEMYHFSRFLDAARQFPWSAVQPGAPVQDHNVRLLMAEREGEPLAGMILAVSGDYALYLYGASSGTRPAAMPAYLLQWEAMQAARRLGARRYDMFGIPSDRRDGHPMHGLLRFKEGFGGRHVVRRGCWDFPFDESRYHALALREAAEGGYHR